MAGTAHNERFGTMAGVPRWIVLQNSKLCGSWQVCESPPSPSRRYVSRHSRTGQGEKNAKNYLVKK
jgi:hypothetical protein